MLIRSQLPLAYLANGQRIPEDLYSAAGRKGWLIKRSLELMRARSFSVSDRYMADNYFAARVEERV